jgi:hypothetical protein
MLYKYQNKVILENCKCHLWGIEKCHALPPLIQLELGLNQSGSFHFASQTKIGLPPAVWMLYWLLPSPRKLRSNRLAMKEGGFLEVAGGN